MCGSNKDNSLLLRIFKSNRELRLRNSLAFYIFENYIFFRNFLREEKVLSTRTMQKVTQVLRHLLWMSDNAEDHTNTQKLIFKKFG